MRYYDLSLLTPSGQMLALTNGGFAASKTGLPTFSSRVRQNGQSLNNPGALDISFDIPIVGYALPQGTGFIRVNGIGIKAIAQGSNLNPNPAAKLPGAKVLLSAGMAKGLPLATAQSRYAGLIAQGRVYNAYGHWEGTEQSLDINILPPGDLTPEDGINFIWQPGEDLGNAITRALSIAFPNMDVSTAITPGFVQTQSNENVGGQYESLGQFAGYIYELTLPLGAALTGNDYYGGVNITVVGDSILATDATQNPKTVQLQFTDLLGQPTWLGPNQISFKTVLRADIRLFDFVVFPPDPGGGNSIMGALALTSAAAIPGSPARSRSVFQGPFLVTEIHQYGSFRQPDGDAWCTAFRANVAGPAPT